ncbi:MAG: hypothetical protein HFF18_12215 [Oscillospiraceae bacterium]|nr:hypothetical protein [Oscillospiraceae bacterium]
MYNRYIPQGEPFQPTEPPPRSGPAGSSFFQSLFGQEGEKNAGLSGILKALKLDRFDKGDLLLILLLLYLVWNGKEEEGDSKELLIILGLLLLLGL